MSDNGKNTLSGDFDAKPSAEAGGRAFPGSPVHSASRSQDKLDVIVGTENRVYTAAWEPRFTDGWHGWWPMAIL